MFLGDFYEFSGAFFTDSIFTFPVIFRIIRAHSEMSSSFLLAYELPVDRRMLRVGAISERKQNGSLCFFERSDECLGGLFVVLFFAAWTD